MIMHLYACSHREYLQYLIEDNLLGVPAGGTEIGRFQEHMVSITVMVCELNCIMDFILTQCEEIVQLGDSLTCAVNSTGCCFATPSAAMPGFVNSSSMQFKGMHAWMTLV